MVMYIFWIIWKIITNKNLYKNLHDKNKDDENIVKVLLLPTLKKINSCIIL